MGLMYQFPTNLEDPDHVIKQVGSIRLRSYGLPPIFWFYLAGILIVFFFLCLNVWNPLKKMLAIGTGLDLLLVYSLLALIIFTPLILIAFYFYEKNLVISKHSLIIIHKIFFIPFRKITYHLDDDSEFFLEHFIDSPNMARIKDEKAMKAFQNRGYFELFLIKNGKRFYLDRHSVHAQLAKIKAILESFSRS